MKIKAGLQEAVRTLAKARCEHCHFPEEFAELRFEFDHIIATQHGGKTQVENLAFACAFCNRFKGPNLAGIDPVAGVVTRLFNPRRDNWSDHFAWNGPVLVGSTPIGRATIHALKINAPDSVATRQVIRLLGEHNWD